MKSQVSDIEDCETFCLQKDVDQFNFSAGTALAVSCTFN